MRYHLDPSQIEMVISAVGRRFKSGHPELAFAYLLASFAEEQSFADAGLGIGPFSELRSALQDELSPITTPYERQK